MRRQRGPPTDDGVAKIDFHELERAIPNVEERGHGLLQDRGDHAETLLIDSGKLDPPVRSHGAHEEGPKRTAASSPP